jgi:micrococcal nuclease
VRPAGRVAAAALLTIAVLAAPAPAQPAGSQEERQVTLGRVVDGDTLELRGGTRVRLIGVDTPETVHPDFGHECFGEEATRYTERLLRRRRGTMERRQSASGKPIANASSRSWRE